MVDCSREEAVGVKKRNLIRYLEEVKLTVFFDGLYVENEGKE